MISISDALMEYLSKTTREEGQYVRAEIRTSTGVLYSISDDDLSGGTVKVSKKSVSGNCFSIGECYINEMSMTVIDKENRFKEPLDGGRLTLYFGVKNATIGLNEEIKVGTYVIPTDTTVRKIASTQIYGDSLLSTLDLPTNNVVTNGTPYDLISWCSDMTGVELAQTKEEFNSLSENTKFTFSIEENSAIETYRDVVMYVSQIIGGFATDTNDGKLIFKNYVKNANVFKINNDTIATSSLGDTKYNLDGISIEFNGDTVYGYGDENSEYVLELDSNPLFEKIEEDLVKVILENIYNQLGDIDFRSFNFQYNGNPALECGDKMLNEVREVSSYITSLDWTYHSKSTITGATLDNRTKTKNQGVKKASSTGGGGGSTSNELSILRYINAQEYKLSAQDTNVCQMYFIIPGGVSPFFSFVMTTKAEKKGIISARIIYDNVEMVLKPKIMHTGGFSTMSFSKSFDATDTQIMHSVNVYVNFEWLSDNTEIEDEDVVVEVYGIEANIMGWRATSGSAEWTGRYELSDTIAPIMIEDNIIKVVQIKEGDIEVTSGEGGQIDKIQVTALEAEIHGTAVLRRNSSVPGGYDIDYIGNYPGNGADFKFTLPNDSKILLSVNAATGENRYLDVYIDNILVSDNKVFNTGDYDRGATVDIVAGYDLTAGEHTIGVGKDTGSYAPIVAYVEITYIKK